MPATYLFLTGWEFGALGNLTSNMAVSAAQARTGTYSAYCNSTTGAHAIATIPAQAAEEHTVYVGVAFRPTVLGTHRIIQIGNNTVADECSLRMLGPDGALGIYARATKVGEGGQLAANVWHFIEIACKVAVEVGLFYVYLDGQQIAAFGGNTCSSGEEWITKVTLGHTSVGGTVGYFDDFMVAIDGRTGRCGIELLRPNAVGNTTQWTPSEVEDNFALVNEVPPDDDTYVFSETENHVDTYGLTDLTLEGVVKALQWNCRARLAEEGSGNIRAVLRSDGTDYPSDILGIDSTFKYLSQCYTNDPATDAAWERAAVAALQAGMKVV